MTRDVLGVKVLGPVMTDILERAEAAWQASNDEADAVGEVLKDEKFLAAMARSAATPQDDGPVPTFLRIVSAGGELKSTREGLRRLITAAQDPSAGHESIERELEEQIERLSNETRKVLTLRLKLEEFRLAPAAAETASTDNMPPAAPMESTEPGMLRNGEKQLAIAEAELHRQLSPEDWDAYEAREIAWRRSLSKREWQDVLEILAERGWEYWVASKLRLVAAAAELREAERVLAMLEQEVPAPPFDPLYPSSEYLASIDFNPQPKGFWGLVRRILGSFGRILDGFANVWSRAVDRPAVDRVAGGVDAINRVPVRVVLLGERVGLGTFLVLVVVIVIVLIAAQTLGLIRL